MALKSIIPITPELTLVDEDRVLNKVTGEVYSLLSEEISQIVKQYIKGTYGVAVISEDIQEVLSVESQQIYFYHKTSNGALESRNGFLVEVYLSGSNINEPDSGSQRLFAETIEDPLDENKNITDSFSSYFKLEVDV
jgi:hypothetical protein